MFVAGFLLGLLVAMLLSWFWLSQLNNVSPFQQVVQREVEEEDYKEMFMALESEMEEVQNQIQRIGDALAQQQQHQTMPEVERRIQDRQQAFASRPDFAGEAKKEVRGNRKREKQGEVLGLWSEGREVDEIARDTGLGQGEVELILSLRNKLGRQEAL